MLFIISLLAHSIAPYMSLDLVKYNFMLLSMAVGLIMATIVTHLSVMAWGGFQIYNTGAFHKDFKRLATDGACQVNLLPTYWVSRTHTEIPSLTFNVTAVANLGASRHQQNVKMLNLS
ncbi:hypothetical protein BC826DRAFT_1110269 [Russula brevipes]|nr:hypothetical protein BC826DRAFT_1110269 [Russula brevipes]